MSLTDGSLGFRQLQAKVARRELLLMKGGGYFEEGRDKNCVFISLRA